MLETSCSKALHAQMIKVSVLQVLADMLSMIRQAVGAVNQSKGRTSWSLGCAVSEVMLVSPSEMAKDLEDLETAKDLTQVARASMGRARALMARAWTALTPRDLARATSWATFPVQARQLDLAHLCMT